MRNRKKMTACMLAAAVTITSIMAPAGMVQAEENKTMEADDSTASGMTMSDTAETDAELSGMTDEELEEAVAAADGVDTVDLPQEDGKYVVYIDSADSADGVQAAAETPEAAAQGVTTEMPEDLGEGIAAEAIVQEIAAETPEAIVQEIAEEAPEVILEADLSAEQAAELEALGSQSDDVYIEENIYLSGASDDYDPDIDLEYIDNSFLMDMDAMERYNWKKSQVDQDMEEDEEDEWNVQMVHADGLNGEDAVSPVKVAVLDSGVEFLAGFPVQKSVNLVKEEQELAYYMNDMTGHGTAVADIIHRVCPTAQIYSVKVMDAKNRGRLSDIVAGIYWCIEQDVDVINMSFGTSVKSEILEKAIQAAAEAGIMMVSSAGNGGTGSAVEYPAAFPEVIAVGAVDTSAQKTEESATGAEVELAAPGEQILAKSLLGFDTVNSGTSMAAPHVAGAAALLLQESRYQDPAFIRRVLQKSSNPIGDEASYGSGLLDVARAQELLKEYEEIVMEEQQSGVAEETAAESGTEVPVEASEEAADTEIQASERKEEDTFMDALDEVEQTAKPVETFEEIDYVEGRWAKEKHADWAEEWGISYGFTQTAINLFKAGAMYPDPIDHHMHDHNQSYWHGSKDNNYIANYIYVTRAALTGGDLTGLGPEPGMETVLPTLSNPDEQKRNKCVYEDIKANMSADKLYGKKWTTVISDIAQVKGYTGQKRWRQVFIYGMALHILTDAYAHSSYYRASDGTIKKFYHKDSDNENYDPNFLADDLNDIPNRWKCARYLSNYVAINCDSRIAGDAGDFSAYGESCWNGFYMIRILRYAREVNSGFDAATLETWFRSMDYKS